MKRLLFLNLGPYFVPTEIPVMEYYRWLSTEFEGDVFAVVHKKEFRSFTLGNFDLVGMYLPKWVRGHTILRDIAYALFVWTRGPIRHLFKKKYDVVICKEPLVTGVLALVLRWLFGAQLIVEVNGNFESAFRVNSQNVSLMERLKGLYAASAIPRVLNGADGVKLVYSRQLGNWAGRVVPGRIFTFPNFVPIHQFEPSKDHDQYILFCGYPWHLKGVDILIRAFQMVSGEFPNYRLKIVGYCPDKTLYQELAAGNSRIELCDAVWYAGIKELMRKCALFVLPSRTDSSPRVLREAMASQKPIIASNVDGIPALIQDGYNGLLFESENVEDLASKMRAVLCDPKLADTLAENGLTYVHEKLSEKEYMRHFSRMIGQVTSSHAH